MAAVAIAARVNCPAHALGEDSTATGSTEAQGSLAAAAQNPITAMVSLPFQNNTFLLTVPPAGPVLGPNSRSVPLDDAGDCGDAEGRQQPA
ncbi:hypothetical protein DF3PB_1770005 [uncultured Defluviicoccus sp.]|uniref:Uncharacterized protein n=1 Tax=metagenome TaxID=256318 RepID=A0A380TB71_9ZZZZ|nr:hypothetical protein DF3PB_1770005 [uncultured Defluviicoccus sp.]